VPKIGKTGGFLWCGYQGHYVDRHHSNLMGGGPSRIARSKVWELSRPATIYKIIFELNQFKFKFELGVHKLHLKKFGEKIPRCALEMWYPRTHRKIRSPTNLAETAGTNGKPVHRVMIYDVVPRKKYHACHINVYEKNSSQKMPPGRTSLGFLPKWSWFMQVPYQTFESWPRFL
jgi:hypothetical protein